MQSEIHFWNKCFWCSIVQQCVMMRSLSMSNGWQCLSESGQCLACCCWQEDIVTLHWPLFSRLDDIFSGQLSAAFFLATSLYRINALSSIAVPSSISTSTLWNHPIDFFIHQCGTNSPGLICWCLVCTGCTKWRPQLCTVLLSAQLFHVSSWQ